MTSNPLRRVEPSSGSTGSPSGSELLQALAAWREHGDTAATALAEQDIDGVDQALQARDQLRPRIDGLMQRVRSEGGASTELLALLARSEADSAAADARLQTRMKAKRARLGEEIDALRQSSGTVAAYHRPHQPSPHRLNIVR